MDKEVVESIIDLGFKEKDWQTIAKTAQIVGDLILRERKQVINDIRKIIIDNMYVDHSFWGETILSIDLLNALDEYEKETS